MTGSTEQERLSAAIDAQEQLRGSVPDEIVATTIAMLQERLDQLADPHRMKRRKLATVLFADVSGSTALGERIDAEELSIHFDVLWSRIDSIIQRHGGQIDKHIGDAVMALWGADRTDEDDPERATRAALEMCAALDAMRSDGTIPPLSMRIGVNTGPVVVGVIAGTDEVTAMGDTVNVAARLEAAAPPDTVLIGHDTYRHVRGVFTVTARPPLTVKGKQRPLRTYIVHGTRPRAFRLPNRAIEGVETHLIGRASELDRLRDLLGQVRHSGQARSILIVGEPGIGKSRLIDEFEDWLHLQPDDVRLFRGRGDPVRGVTPYGLLRDLLFARFEITDQDADEIALAKIAIGLRQLGDDALARQAPFLGHLFGVGATSRIADDGRHGDATERTAHLMLRLLALVAARTPVVILLEDLQWADRASLDMLDSVMSDLTDSRVLIVAAARPTELERRWPDCIILTPLRDDDIGALLDELLVNAESVPRWLTDDVVGAAAGNPFYVEELVRMLIDDEIVVVADGVWEIRAERFDRLTVPSTISGLIEARLDRLTGPERATMRRAAIAGRSFTPDMLPRADCGVAGLPSDLAPVLESLGSSGLLDLHGSSGGNPTCRFQHEMIYDVTYQSMLRRDRQTLHRDLAERMAAQTDATPSASIVAHHFRAAGADADAAPWFARAGAEARRHCAAEEAIAACESALASGALDAATALAVLDDLCQSYVIAARYEAAGERAVEMESLARQEDRPRDVALALMHRSHIHVRLGANTLALEAAELAHELIAGIDDAGDEAIDTATEIAWVLLRLGRADEAIERGAAALAMVGVRSSLRSQRGPHTVLGAAYNARGDSLAATEHLTRALMFDREFGDLRGSLANLNNLGEVARLGGDLHRAIGLFVEALTAARDIGDIDQEALIESNLGGALVEIGEIADGLDHLERAVNMFERSGSTEHLSETHRFTAQAHASHGDIAAAERHALAALELAELDRNADHLGHAWRVVGLTAARCAPDHLVLDTAGTRRDAIACIERSVSIFRSAHMERDVAHTLGDLARVLRQAGEIDRARAVEREATDLLDRVRLGNRRSPIGTSSSDEGATH